MRLCHRFGLKRVAKLLRLRDGRHRLFLSLPRRFMGGRPGICQKHRNDILWQKLPFVTASS